MIRYASSGLASHDSRESPAYVHAGTTSELVQSPLLRSVGAVSSHPQLEALFRVRATEALDANEVLFYEGDPAQFLFEIESGCVRIQRALSDGKRAIVTFLFAGEVMNAAAAGQHRFAAEAVTHLEIRRLSQEKMMSNLATNPELRDELFSLVRNYLVVAMEHSVILGRMSAQSRVAAFLLAFAERFSVRGDLRVIELPMNRLDIADYLGLTIESVSRALTHLKGQGYISIPAPHQITLRNVHGLHVVAGINLP